MRLTVEHFAAIAVAVLGGERLVLTEPVLYAAAVARALELLGEGLVGFLVRRLSFPGLICHVGLGVSLKENRRVRVAKF